MLGLGVDVGTVRDAVFIMLTYREAMNLRKILNTELDSAVALMEDVREGRESAAQLPETVERLSACARIMPQLDS